MGKSTTRALEPAEGSRYATAQLEVPRSMPTRYSRAIFFSHVQLELPSARAAFFQAAQFERPHFGDCSLQIYRHQTARLALQGSFDGSDLFEIIASSGIIHRVPHPILTSYR